MGLASEAGVPLHELRLFHWGIPQRPLPEVNWFDLLRKVVFGEPLAVRNSLGFRLDEIVRALHAMGLVETALPPLPPAPLATMAAVWWSAQEAEKIGATLDQTLPIQAIANHDKAACRAMMEIVGLLRQRSSMVLPHAA